MTPELTVLTLAALLQVLQFSAYSATSIQQVGPKKAAGPRDNPIQLTGTAGRLQRAMNNHFEALILFTIAVLATQLSGQNTSYTAACSYIYLGARILYVPAYVFGLAPWRSVIWFIGLLATVAMLTAALI
ncbi:MAPEG family protein [Sulfitobacter guttiformis]|uniref:Putative MAPEG superfamily protein n=1 Tax=Sulfitobacter guttiformis TaxID=74349 RepID=A0A420DUE8_9RHOB|nr:MAPEG family protein [Sulfitobacter guttiformis]KIN71352.1 Inner membrane protein [Sulfitobacter guttiformis KCTC 32187]RKE97800.1 putative MAPEG superfamily protein [Sulfitobacter guttiformis]